MPDHYRPLAAVVGAETGPLQREEPNRRFPGFTVAFGWHGVKIAFEHGRLLKLLKLLKRGADRKRRTRRKRSNAPRFAVALAIDLDPVRYRMQPAPDVEMLSAALAALHIELPNNFANVR